ncbi:Ni-sirohydrochlorin a,c-diamide synthase [Methanoplanus sp. FWC-SCC4]|uniref:Cobyrinate a,c-diamide synthase n=1 Tax=Methanochimaera problematica TaxID=2609417 RepID=A0AA97I2I4_9EURY|nr:Ni-sirohydrochlorin a,c-diamide synthase [Methanoplanus sp. FWC-SCC4]WOF16305.1 Ni-sirohydrochlorin a,c-diamide synthase [Methanoplanus sp. FWC-SCC4]
MKSLLISGDRSGSGKTSITLGISAYLSRQYEVQPFKVAMDYIDPSYLTGVTGRMCRNLDSYVMSPEQIRASYDNACIGSDIAIIEGVRGLYEGSDAILDTGSTASVAKMLDQNVILVVNAQSITRSAAAIVKGFCSFDPAVKIKGIILNQVISEKHKYKAKTAIEHETGIPVIGAIPRREEMKLTMRHLGLVPFLEGKTGGEFMSRLDNVVNIIENNVDMDALLDIAGEKPDVTEKPAIFAKSSACDVKLGVAVDEAFNFYYNDIYEILSSFGAEVVTFSPIHDRLPDCDGYIFGGGYPEMFAEQLESNDSMREAVLEESLNGKPVYAECGGLIYLTEKLTLKKDWNNQPADMSYSMAGVFEGETRMPAKRVIGYVDGVSNSKSPLGISEFKGHEFHHSDVILPKDTHFCYSLSRGLGIRDGYDGALKNRTLAGYTHLHPVASREMFKNFVDECRNPV